MNTLLKIFKRVFAFGQAIVFVLIAVLAVKAQTNGVDLSFNAIPDKNSTSTARFVLQPDNKLIVLGDFQVVNGVVNNRIARLNADGRFDTTFNCAVCNFAISSVVVQPDGKIIVAGNMGDYTPAVIYRLNADGSRDASFTSPFPVVSFPQTHSAWVVAVQPDGKFLTVLFSGQSSFSSYTLYRLNTDGTYDSAFTSSVIGGGGITSQQAPTKISVLPNGKILFAVNISGSNSANAYLRRYNADGTLDSTFEAPTLTNDGGFGSVASIQDFDVQVDGSLLIVGRFAAVNAVSRRNIVKLQAAGNVDSAFNTSSFSDEIFRVEDLPDGKILISQGSRFYRLNADGGLDSAFNAPANITLIYRWNLDAAGRIFFYALISENGADVAKFARLNQDGSYESSFAANLGILSSVSAVAAQADGKAIFAGDFVRVGGVPRVSIARVNADGSLDATFDAGTGFSGSVSKIIVQPNGKILVAGEIYGFNGTSRRAIVRLNANGSLDVDFNLGFSTSAFVAVYSAVLQPDGKILIGGTFNVVNGEARNGITRLNTDGSLDESFNPTFGAATIRSIIWQADGKIMVGGTFSGVGGFNRQNLVRLNADGSLDSAFNVGTIAAVNQVEILPDGKYLALTHTVIRLNNNGAADTTFTPPNLGDSGILRFFAVPDGSVLIGGNFTTVNSVPRPKFARLRPNGALDNGFLPSGANAAVRAIVRQADGRVLVGGDFSVIGNTARLSVARLNVTYRAITPYDYDGDGRADLTVFRPSNGYWYELNIQTNGFYAIQFGQSGDKPAPADYDGDGKTDIAVFRDVVTGAGNFAYFYILNSSDNSFRFGQFGATGDVPMAGDWDGDGKADLAVYRNGTAGGQSYFYYRPSSQPTVNYYTLPLGIEGDKPLLGDFDGDGRLDPAVFRPQNAFWYILQSSINQVATTSFGLSTDIPVPADYDGDGKTNIAVFRPSNGTWFTSTNAQNNYGSVQFGASEDLPVPADYDGDGRADVAVFRPSNGAWYLNRSTQGFTGVQFGQSGDKPSPNAFIR